MPINIGHKRLSLWFNYKILINLNNNSLGISFTNFFDTYFCAINLLFHFHKNAAFRERLPRWITRSRIISVVFFTFKKLLIKVLINILHERKKCGKTRPILKCYEKNATSVTLELIKRESSTNPIKTKLPYKISDRVKFIIKQLIRNIQQL